MIIKLNMKIGILFIFENCAYLYNGKSHFYQY